MNEDSRSCTPIPGSKDKTSEPLFSTTSHPPSPTTTGRALPGDGWCLTGDHNPFPFLRRRPLALSTDLASLPADPQIAGHEPHAGEASDESSQTATNLSHLALTHLHPSRSTVAPGNGDTEPPPWLRRIAAARAAAAVAASPTPRATTRTTRPPPSMTSAPSSPRLSAPWPASGASAAAACSPPPPSPPPTACAST